MVLLRIGGREFLRAPRNSPSVAACAPLSVSIIIPVYNDATRLRRLLDSLQREQAQGEVEIIVVDNRSTDEVDAVVAAFSGVCLLRESQSGAYQARNTGAAAARGELFVFTDADCLVRPGWLGALRAAFGDGVGAVAGPIRGTPPRHPAERFSEERELLSQERYMRARPRPVAATANLAVRATAFRALGGFNGRLHSMGDFEFCHRLQDELGLKLVLAPQAVVWHEHRSSWRSLFWQSFRDGVGWAYIRQRIPGFALPAARLSSWRGGPSAICYGVFHYGGLVLGYVWARICAAAR